MGRNAVFALGKRSVVKVMPPQWADEAKKETAALNLVANQVPFSTPELVHTGDLNGWPYLIAVRLYGKELYKLWPKLQGAQRTDIAHQMGKATACFHSLELPEGSIHSSIFI